MSQEHLKKLHELEETVEKLKEARVRASERLNLLRKQRDIHIAKLKKYGINPKTAQTQLTKMSDEIDAELAAIDAQIPENLEGLIDDEDDYNDDRD